jgi:Fe-S-cluster containining protein
MLLDDGSSVPFKRTFCSCGQCKQNCINCPSYLLPDDLQAYGKVTGFDQLSSLAPSKEVIEWGKSHLISTTFYFNECSSFLPVLIPKSNDDDGACVNYNDGNCMVHDHSPFGCRMFDCQTTREDVFNKNTFSIGKLAPIKSCIDKEIPPELLTEPERLYWVLLKNCRTRHWEKRIVEIT